MTDQPQQPIDIDVRQSIAAGDYRAAFERLLGLYSTKVFHLAYSMLRNETQAEDMTQEIFLRIWKGLPGYHGGAAVSTWIYAIARNTCLTELKKRAARPTVSFFEPEFEGVLDHLPALQTHGPESSLVVWLAARDGKNVFVSRAKAIAPAQPAEPRTCTYSLTR